MTVSQSYNIFYKKSSSNSISKISSSTMLEISVIIPTFNREQELERALLSVAGQSAPCAEIIVIDDGSTDKTKEMVDLITTEQNLPLRYFYQQNRGVSAARNAGIRKSRYPIIAFLDSDDHFHKKKLGLQYKGLIENSAFLISHTREKWLRRGNHLNQKKKHQPGNGDIFSHCLKICAVGMSTVMVRRELFDLVGYFNEKYHCCEDYDLWLRTSCRFPFLLINEALTVKEGGREDQLSQKYRVGMDKFRIAAMENLLRSDYLSEKQRQITLQEFRKKCNIYGNGCLKHGKIAEGNQYLNMAGLALKTL